MNVEHLPDDILAKICTWPDFDSLVVLARTCKIWEPHISHLLVSAVRKRIFSAIQVVPALGCSCSSSAKKDLRIIIRSFIMGKHPEWLKLEAVRILPMIVPRGDEVSTKVLLSQLEDRGLRYALVDALKLICDDSTCAIVVKRLESDIDIVQQSVVSVLTSIARPQVIPYVLPLLQSESSSTKLVALEVIRELGIENEEILASLKMCMKDNCWRDLQACLNDQRWKVRAGALTCLSMLSDDATPVLQHLHDEDWRVRRRTLVALRRKKGDVVVANQVMSSMEDCEWRVRMAAVQTLKEILNKCEVGVIEQVICRLEDSEAGVRFAAVELLKDLPCSLAKSGLQDRLQDSCWWVQRAAQDCLDIFDTYPEDYRRVSSRPTTPGYRRTRGRTMACYNYY